MRRKVLTIIAVVLGSLFVFVIAIFVTLPTDSIRHLAEKKIEEALKHKQAVEIESLSISPLLNVTANNFKMTPRRFSNEPQLELEGNTYNGFYCAPSVDEQTFVIDEVFVKPAIFSSIRGKPGGKFTLTIQNGTIEGEASSQKNKIEVSANGKDISLNEFALISNFTKMQIYGMLRFDIPHVLVERNNLAELKASIFSDNTAMCPKRLKLDMAGLPYIDLPFTVFGNIEANIEIDHDKLIIHKLTSDGPDLKLNITGDVMLKSQKNPVPRLNIRAIILPSQEWVTENSMKIIYQICEKHDDGSIHLDLTGTTKRIKHECGTPIPEPEEEIVPPVKIDSDTKAESQKDTKSKDTNADKDKDSDDAPVREHSERSGVFKAPSVAPAPEDAPEPPPENTRPSRMGRPSNLNRPLPPGAQERLNKALDEDEAADDENRRLRRQNRPTPGRGRR